MRLQLSRALGVLVAIAATPAAADTSFVSKVQVYADNDHTQVVSPVVDAQADVHAGTTVSLGYLADVVSSASVDIVSQASGRTIHDTRHQVSSSVSQDLGSLTAHAGYTLLARERLRVAHARWQPPARSPRQEHHASPPATRCRSTPSGAGTMTCSRAT